MVERIRWPTGAVLGTTLLGAPACCVCASTLVRTPSGPRRLGELQLGEEVLSLAVDSGELVPTQVVGLRTARRECLRIHCSGGELVCTPDHPIYSPESDEYEPASRWADGVRRFVLRVEGERPVVEAVVRVEAFAGLREVVDLTVDSPMHNFVAGGLLVHNKSYITMVYGYDEGPEFVLGPDDLLREFQIRACVNGKDPSPEENGSYLHVFLSTEDDPASAMGEMRFALYFPKQGEDETPFADYASDADPYLLFVGSLSGACLSPLSIAFERLDELSDGAIGFTWDVRGATEPPPGTDLDDELLIDVTEE
jgi:hypothetical protein